MSTGREDMFSSSVSYYTEYRKPYPQQLFDLIREQFRPDGQGGLLDVGCGSGQIALPLSGWFRRVVGVDISDGMVGAAGQNAMDQGIDNAEFHAMPGEEVASLPGEFNLVTYGSALHWMDTPRALAASGSKLALDGGVAVLGMRSIWGGESDWERVVVSVVQKWLGQDRRAGSGTFDKEGVRHEVALANAGFDIFDSGDVEASYALDVDFILGHLYTTSYCSRELLGDRVSQFEKDIRRELYRVDTGGTYRWSPGANYIFARKRD